MPGAITPGTIQTGQASSLLSSRESRFAKVDLKQIARDSPRSVSAGATEIPLAGARPGEIDEDPSFGFATEAAGFESSGFEVLDRDLSPGTSLLGQDQGDETRSRGNAYQASEESCANVDKVDVGARARLWGRL